MNNKNPKEDKTPVTFPEVEGDEGAQELSEEELDEISGGKVSVQEIHVTKIVDKSSPNLFGACATGKHFPTGTITTH